MTSSRRHELFYDTHPKKLTSHDKFDVCTPSSFGRVKTDRQTDRIGLYILYQIPIFDTDVHGHFIFIHQDSAFICIDLLKYVIMLIRKPLYFNCYANFLEMQKKSIS